MTDVIRILIAEDDPQIAEIQRRFVERVEGFEIVGICHSTIDTSDMVDVLKPDLVLLDIQFPDGSGLDLLRQMRAAESRTDVIMVTAAKEVDSLSEALRLGVFDYVLKPLVFDRLAKALEHFKAHHRTLADPGAELSQNEVDKLLPRHQQNDQTADTLRAILPKGIDQLTLDKVNTVFLENQGSFSAEQVSEEIGTSRTTARRYLEYLVGQKTLIADINYGTVGRPERLYKSVQ